MRVVLRRMEDLGGLPVAADEVIEADRITLGRGTDQDVQLADMRVTLAHAEIRQQPGGGFRIECTGENPVTVNGSPTRTAALGAGDVVEVGRFRLTVDAAPADVDLLLQVEETMTAREAAGRRRAQYHTSLEQAGLGKRRAAWGLAVLVLLPLFAAPVALRFGAAATGPSLDVVLQSGPGSAAHAAFVEDCAACHEAPFASVRTEACAACHRDQPHHSARPEVLALPGMDDGACGDCHAEHSGRDGLIARNPALCTACHADPDARFAVAGLAPARRFGDAHPAFTPAVPAWRDGRFTRVEAAAGTVARDSPNLNFAHDVHVADKGLSSPEGLRVLACADCHRAAGPSFEPVRMEQHCAGCHRLDFDPDAPDQRLPHRAPREVAALIRGYYARVALAGEVKAPDAPEVVRLLRRPGEVLTPAQAQAALAWADARATAVMQDVFERRVCASCHQVVATDDAGEPWQIEPVALSRSFLTDARFDHAAHRTEPCARCHQAQSSTTSADLLLPGIEDCRACHGDPGDRGLIGSACVDCHRFHVTGTMTAPSGAAP
jgi:predicted CXXCH cytochrome family protein